MFSIRSFKDLGFRTDNIFPSLLPYLILTCILVVGLHVFLNTVGSGLLNLWNSLYPSVLVLILISVIQEIFFRGYLMLVLKRAFRNVFIVVLFDALVFAAAHLVFPFSTVLILGAFIAGLGFAVVYYYYPNLYLASVAHVILNMAVIPFCYFKLIGC